MIARPSGRARTGPPWGRIVRGPALLSATLLGACAGSTLGSGVGDTWIDRPPYYAGSTAADTGRVGAADVLYLPVYVQPDPDAAPRMGASAGDGANLARLVEAMNAELASAAAGRGWRRSPTAIPGEPPDVQLGCEADVMGDCMIDEDDLGNPVWNDDLRLAVTRGSPEWRDAAVEVLSRENASAIVLLTIETGWYWPRQTNWRGSKVVELGTERIQELPWLTALDRPVQVLQVTGLAFGPDGRARRIGGEGLLARRTPIVLSGFGIDALVSDEDVARLLDGGAGVPDWRSGVEVLLRELVPAR